MTEPRRLTAEMRQEIQRKLDGEHPSDVSDRLKPALVDLHNALHDLDVADRELVLLRRQLLNVGTITWCEKCGRTGYLPNRSACCRISGHAVECNCPICQWMRSSYRQQTEADRLRADLAAAQATITERDAWIEALESGIANGLEEIRLEGEKLRGKNHELCAKLAACSAQNLRWEGEANELRADLAAARAQIAALREALGKIGLHAEDLEFRAIDSQAKSPPINRSLTESEMRMYHHGRGQIASLLSAEIRYLLAVDTAQLAADHTARIQAQARQQALEEVRQILSATVDGEPIQPAEIERRIMALAAPPEKEAP